jgi:glutamine amidotransferase
VDPAVVRGADVLIVPGQGAFGAFVDAIDRHGLRELLCERIASGIPYLGICLGLQVLFESSDEAPGARGLGVLAGHVHRLTPGADAEGRALSLPHIGWNEVASADPSLVPSDHFYFAHTFAAVPTDASAIVGRTDYGTPFVSAVKRDNVLGVQFHPEKSQHVGLTLLRGFFERARGTA